MRKFKKILLTILVVALLFGGYYLYDNYYLKEAKDNNSIQEETIDNSSSNNSETKTAKDQELFIVDIKGYVVKPGAYSFDKENVTIQDVIDIAGGLNRLGDTSNINCSEYVSNHSVIYIGSKEAKSYVLESGEEIKKININTCTKEDFMSLSGIGEKKATDIIEYRTKNGYFNNIEEIKEVNGIGESIFKKIKDFITV